MRNIELTIEECLEVYKKYDKDLYDYYLREPLALDDKAKEYAKYVREKEILANNLIEDIYKKAMNETFTNDVLESENFDTTCHKAKIDEKHTICIWGDSILLEDNISRAKFFSINIIKQREKGNQLLFYKTTKGYSKEDLHNGIKDVINTFLCVAN